MKNRLVIAVAAFAAGCAITTATAATGWASQVIRGSGARVVSVKLARTGPLVVTATHNGSANFIVKLVRGAKTEYLFNEIGAYGGQIAVPRVVAGQHRAAVDADGAWTLAFAQPLPSASARRIPTTIIGRGAKVFQVRAGRGLSPVVTASHTGAANFIVRLIGLGKTSGTEYLFNEIGRYRGQTLVGRLPLGTYLLAVQADGAWSVRIVP